MCKFHHFFLVAVVVTVGRNVRIMNRLPSPEFSRKRIARHLKRSALFLHPSRLKVPGSLLFGVSVLSVMDIPQAVERSFWF